VLAWVALITEGVDPEDVAATKRAFDRYCARPLLRATATARDRYRANAVTRVDGSTERLLRRGRARRRSS